MMNNIRIVFAIIVSIVLIGLLVFIVSIGYQNEEMIKCTIEDKWVKRKDKSDMYLVQCDNEVYQITDLLFKGKFNSSDIYANLKVGNDIFATFVEVHPKVIMNYRINQKVYIAEININKITKYAKINKKYQPIPKFPALERDIAIVVDENVEVGTIEKIIEKKSNKMLEELKLFDVYRSDKLGNNKKSVAYNLKFRIKDRTLKDEEVNTVMKNILEQLEKELNAELRK